MHQVTEPVTALLSPDLLEAVDAWIAGHDPKPFRPDVISYALRDWLTGLGLLPFHDDPEAAN